MKKSLTDKSIPPALAAIAAGRDHITTQEFARAINCAPQTIRKNHCLSGECFGIRPIKIAHRLLWKVTDVSALLNEGEKYVSSNGTGD